MAERKAKAIWEGTLREGKGTMSFANYSGPYSYMSRFEEGEGTNPEELLGAAHAGCFSMAFAGALSRAGHDPQSIETTARVTLAAQPEGGFRISRVLLETEATVPGIDEAKFTEVAEAAKQNCPVSRALAGVEIAVNARLR
jgi:osmotically inducible protein OsmC